MPKWRDVNSPADFSEIMDALKITPVIKYLVALESSQGIVRASPGFMQLKTIHGFQGLSGSPSVVQTLTSVLCHQPLHQPRVLSEIADLGWEANKGESMPLHMSPLLFIWWLSSTASSVTCDTLAHAALGLKI